MNNICVFASSSDAVDSIFVKATEELGTTIARLGKTLIYGGAHVGLMKTLALTVQENRGKVVGIIPQQIYDKKIGFAGANELIITKDLRERKAVMELRSNCFVALPGGFGTLDEMLEFLTLKQLQLHSKPIIFLNINGFYNPLSQFFEKLYEAKFSKPEYRALSYFAPDVKSVFAYLESYAPAKLHDKWF